jgi:hypothetical protein
VRLHYRHSDETGDQKEELVHVVKIAGSGAIDELKIYASAPSRQEANAEILRKVKALIANLQTIEQLITPQ